MTNSGKEDQRCFVCLEGDNQDGCHISSSIHKFNTLLWEYNEYRKALVKDRHGIQLKVKPLTNIPSDSYIYTTETTKGNHIFKVAPEVFFNSDNRVQFQCTLENISHNNIVISHAQVLHPLNIFKLSDLNNNLENKRSPELEPSASYTYNLHFELTDLTHAQIKIPICFILKPRKEPKLGAKNGIIEDGQFTLVRSVIVEIRDKDYIPSVEKSPFTRAAWSGVHVIPNTFAPFRFRYPIPAEYFRCMLMGLRNFRKMSAFEYTIMQKLRAIVEQPLSPNNYKEFFHILLWLEEAAAFLSLKQYNMEDVHIKLLRRGYLELVVPGLAEKRPSIIPQDRIHIRIHGDGTAYEGIIKFVEESKVIISDVNSELIDILQSSPNLEMDVSFVLGRLPLERMHDGIERVAKSLFIRDLFPTSMSQKKPPRMIFSLPNSEIINKRIINNREQLCAVKNIINCCSQNAPYIVFGPPGTGKTETIVEAILQIMMKTTKRILVCAPANAACDMLARKLKDHCTSQQLLRVHSLSRDEIPKDLEKYSNTPGDNPTAESLKSFRIVVSTLIYIGRYNGSEYKPDFVFIDEAAQALEPEVDVAIGLSSTAQVILAGDPKQLGPVCASKVADQYGLGTSLLDRLMKFDLYKNHNEHYMSMLITNYRSHPDILKLPNELFYEGKLRAWCAKASNDPIARINIFPLIYKTNKIESNGHPNEFCAVFAEEQREGQSPSYFNYYEAQMVVKYVSAILKLNLGEHNVHPSQIGIVTPYKRQVYKLKDMLKCEEIEIGTTETFQGREKRVMIVSSVRGRKNLLLYDKKYRLGFVKQPNRFNVAITRAKSKLIIVGCPLVLQTDEKWLKFMETCEEACSYYGAPMAKRTEELRNDIFSRVTKVNEVSGNNKKRL